MTPFGELYNPGTEFAYQVFECPRKDCEIAARIYCSDLAIELMPGCEYIFEQTDEGTAKIIQLASRRENPIPPLPVQPC